MYYIVYGDNPVIGFFTNKIISFDLILFLTVHALSLCQTWSETVKTSFLASWLHSYVSYMEKPVCDKHKIC